jgi:hypothetical protein
MKCDPIPSRQVLIEVDFCQESAGSQGVSSASNSKDCRISGGTRQGRWVANLTKAQLVSAVASFLLSLDRNIS